MKSEMLSIHEKTKIIVNKEQDTGEYPITWTNIYFKTYPRFKRIRLPKPQKAESKSLYRLILTRQSVRDFNKKQVRKSELSAILYYSAGIINYNKIKNLNDSRRGYPSAGARYPIEMYIGISNCNGVPSGLYHYNVKEHSLELMINNKQNKIINRFIYQDMINSAPIIFILTAVFNRTSIKYGTRAYRYILLDMGHLAQNIYLTATNLSIGCCTIGGFSDNLINDYLDLDKNEQALYMGVLGKYDKH